MNIMRSSKVFLIAVLCVFSACETEAQQWEILSPNEKILISFFLVNDRPAYQFSYEGRKVVDTSYLGFRLNDSLRLDRGFAIESVDDTYFDDSGHRYLDL